jgi:predicted RNA-binding protein YlxR (DUF448 family)
VTKVRKQPVRTCLGCGATGDKRELLRLVRNPEGDVAWDPTGKANGRGAYVHVSAECFEATVRKRRIASALRVNLQEDDVERLRREFENLLAKPQGSLPGR